MWIGFRVKRIDCDVFVFFCYWAKDGLLFAAAASTLHLQDKKVQLAMQKIVPHRVVFRGGGAGRKGAFTPPPPLYISEPHMILLSFCPPPSQICSPPLARFYVYTCLTIFCNGWIRS